MTKKPRYHSGDLQVDARIDAFVGTLGDIADSDLIFEMIAAAVGLARDNADRGDIKIANAAVQELRRSFQLFAPYRTVRKVSIFGSARTASDDPLYRQTVDLARSLSDRDWMVITGAGPGIMEAGVEGAGAENSFGAGIELPFEPSMTEFLDNDPKLMVFRYFFTRKITFLKESDGFVILPGGFGTLDEVYELLTLSHTGKAPLCPIVLLDVPGGTYWRRWREFIDDELLAGRYISEFDKNLFLITDDVDEAVNEVDGFYTNFCSQRHVNGSLVLRIKKAPTEEQLTDLNVEFADIVARGNIEIVGPSRYEIADDDALDLTRLRFRFDRHGFARLRELLNRINSW